MKKLLTIALLVIFGLSARADEGMWLLPYLNKNIKQMKAEGFKLSAQDVYNANGNSLKDAIIVFGNGCTGEIVSPEGLIFTNHHCGYGSIQALSSVEHDYLKDGFWAMNRSEELPAPGLQVRFIRQILDVTPDVLAGIPEKTTEQQRDSLVNVNAQQKLNELLELHPGMEISIKPFFGGNQYFAFVQEVFSDVRLVGAPPTSIGKFGGDTDNWMWPRHTGDFSIFRVYADKDGKPAAYSPDNVPYQTPKHLNISLRGYKPGDFTMIMGFPGSTSRYMSSYEIDQTLGIDNPVRIQVRGERLRLLMEDMKASDKVRIQYASKYAGSSNYYKNAIGMSRGLKKLNVKAEKEAIEARFEQWADSDPSRAKYRAALPLIREAVEGRASDRRELQYLLETIYQGTDLMSRASVVSVVDEKPLTPERLEELGKKGAEFYKDYNLATDRKVAKSMMRLVRDHVSGENLPSIFKEEIEGRFGGNIDAYVDWVYDQSILADEAKFEAFMAAPDTTLLTNDPAVALYRSVTDQYRKLYLAMQPYNEKFNEGHRLFIAGLLEMEPDKLHYPDANFTIRLTYGQVLPYSPADGIEYDYFTTLRGVMEKEDPSNPMEFTVDQKLKELYRTRNYGPYGFVPGKGKERVMPVAFLSNNDITGGNSGSPIMNGRGELIGLAFDGNWEAMSGDIAFEPNLQRTINVDVRYVLFVIDKFAGAGYLLDEMTLVK